LTLNKEQILKAIVVHYRFKWISIKGIKKHLLKTCNKNTGYALKITGSKYFTNAKN
jgi:hypothetical protein